MSELGGREDIAFRYDLMTRTPNTLNAHRLIAAARHEVRQAPIVEALFRAYFTEGRDIGDLGVLADIASEAGMNRSLVLRFLESEEGVPEIRYNDAAAHRTGISGVPAFIFDGRPLLVGAHPPDVIASALREGLSLTAV